MIYKYNNFIEKIGHGYGAIYCHHPHVLRLLFHTICCGFGKVIKTGPDIESVYSPIQGSTGVESVVNKYINFIFNIIYKQ